MNLPQKCKSVTSLLQAAQGAAIQISFVTVSRLYMLGIGPAFLPDALTSDYRGEE